MIWTILQAITAILLIITILLQSKGSGLGAAFGDTTNIQHTKRGAEKFLFQASIVLACIFLVASFLNVLY